MYEDAVESVPSAIEPRLMNTTKHRKTRRKPKKNVNKNQLLIVHVNVRGLKSKIKDISSLAEELDVDIMVFSETKLGGTENRIIRGYKNFRLNRNTRAGGVAIYYKKGLKVTLVKKNPECETVWIKISGDQDLIVGGIYSPCEESVSKTDISNFVRELEKDFVELNVNHEHILMIGDLNAHIGNDDDGILGNNEKIGTNGKEYRRFMKERQLILCNNTSKCKGIWTRTQGDNKSVLDLTIATSEAFDNIESIVVDEENRYSIESRNAKTDHNITSIKMNMTVEKEKEKKRETIRCNGNWEKFNNTLKSDIQSYPEKVNYSMLEKSIRKASQDVIKKTFVTPKQPKIFGYNSTIKNEIKNRRKLCALWKKEKDETKKSVLEIEYLTQREKVNNMIDEAEATEVNKIVEKNGNEKMDFWKTIKRIKKKTIAPTKIRKENGEITDNPTEVLAVKRAYFQKLYAKDDQSKEEKEEEDRIKEKLLEMFRTGNDSDMNKKITMEEVDTSIKKSKDGAPGPDEITNMMLKKSVDIIKPVITDIMNAIKENAEEFPMSWELGDIISFFKGTGDPFGMCFQRGITLTSCVLKTFESVVGVRIEPVIRNNTTSLQGGGKKGESPEEYIFVLQTVVDKNKQENKPTKLIITDVEKAFDQAWRAGVFKNLMKRGINGEILHLIWKMNNNARARIKENSVSHSEIFDVEESIKQGGGLSAILYGQHIGSVVEDLEENELGPKIGSMHVPAIAWQDDVTLIPKDTDEEAEMISTFEDSTDRNRVRLAIEKKTKALTIGKDTSNELTVMKNRIVKETSEAKILGYIFNHKGDPGTHLENRESETIVMMANMGISIEENHMGRIYLRSMLIIYEKCFVHKMLHGLSGVPMNQKHWEKLERIDRNVLRSFLNLPTCTPKVSLYNELGMIPIRFMLWRRKLGMWWRLNRKESNKLMKECLKEQINLGLPWLTEINKIACKLQVDLDSAKVLSKVQWKTLVKEKVLAVAKEYMEKEIATLKGYKTYVEDNIVVGKKKRYVFLTQKKAKIWFRMRTNIIDPAPRQPYSSVSIWKCKFCDQFDQSTEHYITKCEFIKKELFQSLDRGFVFRIIQTLECDEKTFLQITSILMKIYHLINE